MLMYVCTQRNGSVRREIGGKDGSICSLAIMREAGDNIWVLNWYRLTKYPDQEERAAVLSSLYIMSALAAASCTVTIRSILIQTSSPLGLCPNLIFNTVCLSRPLCVYISAFTSIAAKVIFVVHHSHGGFIPLNI